MSQVQQHVRFHCACGKQIEGPSKSFISCPHCFITVGVPDPSRIPVTAPQAAAPPKPVPAKPKPTPQRRPYDLLFIVADNIQTAMIPLSGLCVLMGVVFGMSGNIAVTGIFISAAISGAVWWVALEVAKAIAQIANGVETIVRRLAEADKDKK